MKTRPGAPMCAGVTQGVNKMLTSIVVIARSEATKQSSSCCAPSGLLRFARNDDEAPQFVMLLIWLTV